MLGLVSYGYKVIKTVGEGITKLDFAKGFAAQISTASTVLLSTTLGLSVSTTHILVGSIAGVAIVEKQPVNKKLLGKIMVTWVVTFPAAALISASFFSLFNYFQI